MPPWLRVAHYRAGSQRRRSSAPQDRKASQVRAPFLGLVHWLLSYRLRRGSSAAGGNGRGRRHAPGPYGACFAGLGEAAALLRSRNSKHSQSGEQQSAGTLKQRRHLIWSRQRTEFEYKLRRRTAREDDFLRYIAFEEKLEKLRRIRKRTRSPDSAGVADHAGVRQILFVYERLLKRFSHRERLWLNYMEAADKYHAGPKVRHV
eukprot:scaffold775_cov274-Pinguiococcus_pyrenoidosus.AAC.14